MLDNRDIRLRLMAEHHDKPTASHLGHNGTLELLGWNYYLPDAKKYVETYVAMYNVCTRAKAPHYKPFSLLQLLPILDRAWESVLTNFIVKLLPSRDLGWLSWLICSRSAYGCRRHHSRQSVAM